MQANTLQAPSLARRALPLLLAIAAVLAALAAGHEGSRLLQVLVLALPGWLWLWWPQRAQRARTAQGLLVLGLGLTFVFDGAVRGFLLDAYQAAPNSAMVMSAVANTTGTESLEFVTMYWRDLAQWSLFALAAAGALCFGLYLWWRSPPPGLILHRWNIVPLVLLLALMIGALVNKPWRRYHPVLFWSQWVKDVGALQQQWADLGRQRERLLARAASGSPTLDENSPDTLMLVISESMNRSHLVPYGYPRPT